MKQIKYLALLYTVELGSLTKAGEALGYTQSGISHMINSLESEYGLQLLYRDRAGVQLTSAGQVLLPYFKAVCNSQWELDMVLAELLGGQTGLLRIASHTSIAAQWLPGIFHEFQSKYPKVEFELREVVTNEETRDLLRRGVVDCGFTDAESNDKELHQVFLYRDRFVAILPPDHELAGAPFFPLDALDAYPYIKLDETPGVSNEFTQLMDKLFARQHKSPRVKFRVRDEYTVMAMVANHQGISVLPEMMTWDRAQNQLIHLPLEEPFYRNLNLIVSNRHKNLLLMPAFIETVQNWVHNKYHPAHSCEN